MSKLIMTLLCMLLLLSACGKNSEQAPPKLFEDERAALDKAKQMDAAVREQAEKQKKAIEQTE
jgi:hypothetical protein